MEPLEIDERIERAHTLPGSFYGEGDWWDRTRERLFPRAWLWAGDLQDLRTPGQAIPLQLQGGGLDEPLVLVRGDDDQVRCLSNVCTHRANLVVEGACKTSALRCRYHGRRFRLDGGCAGMPEFDGVEDFPSPRDDLPSVPLGTWQGRFLFASLDPAAGFEDALEPVAGRLGFLPWGELTLDPSASRVYLLRAHWALYVDNYLEGFHVPYVHPSLAAGLDYSSYRTELFGWCNLQVGIARQGEPCFELPSGHADAGQDVAGYYLWLFPTTMLNVYPWGVSVNVVEPLAPDRTRVRYLSYVWDEGKRGVGAGGDLDRVEREDDAVVEACQRGVRARLYDRGRYSATREKGVHHFHRLVARCLNDEDPPGRGGACPRPALPGRGQAPPLPSEPQ